MKNIICCTSLAKGGLMLLTAVCLVLSISSCTGTPEEQTETARQEQEEPALEEEQREELAEKLKPVEEEAETEDEYEMGEEEYQETKRDLSQLVSELNDIISSRDYDSWLEYLTEEYKEHYSEPEVLKEFSDAPVLKKHNISLRSLRDYFNYVVVASRRNVRVDDIKAVGPDKVKAYMDVDGKAVVVYTLEKKDGEWKITR
ncbi:MAG: hypothetical protein ACLFQW_05955 [Spirochaetaceae bacterium]